MHTRALAYGLRSANLMAKNLREKDSMMCRSCGNEERASEDSAGYLWRLNFYWRVQQSDNGCYVELEVISLAREESGRLHPSRFLSSFQSFPQDLTQYLISTLEAIFPHKK